MKSAIILHGTCDKEEYFSEEYPSLSNSHWFPWLQKQLLINGITAQTPEMPKAFNPQYDLWKTTFEQLRPTKSSILVGHSCGGGFLLRWLSENQLTFDKLILVAPWLDPDRQKTTNFFDFELDPNLATRINTHLLISDDDEVDIQTSVDIITAEVSGIITHPFQGMGHFTYGDMKSHKFPELLQTILVD